ncbi:MAG: cation transporter [Bacteroidales bacterium]|nr:cation transporter [Bacteroidales bacterium]
MKKILSLLLITFVIFSCGPQGEKSSSSQQGEEIQSIDPANLETIEIAVYGMTCSGCERTVQTAVGKIPGVQSVKASHLDSTAIVTYDKTKANFEAMKTSITDKGYEVKDFKITE